jgi:hypothetical protein
MERCADGGIMQQGTTITSEMYCKTLKKKDLRKAIRNKRCGMLKSGVLLVLLHDNACLHKDACNSLTRAYKNLFLNMTSSSILEVTTLRNIFGIYVLLFITFFFLIAYFANSSPDVSF